MGVTKKFLGYICLLCLGNSLFGQNTFSPPMEDGAQAKVRIISIYENAMPKAGHVPFIIEITNASKARAVYRVNSTALAGHIGRDGVNSQLIAEIEVEGRSSVRREIYVPVSFNEKTTFSQTRLSLEIRGPGIDGVGLVSLYDSVSADRETTHVYLASQRADRLLTLNYTNSNYSDRSTEFQKAVYSPRYLPTQAAGYESLDGFVLIHSDWPEIPVESQEALLDWVGWGGQIFFMATPNQGAPPSSLRRLGISSEQRKVNRGAGTIAYVSLGDSFASRSPVAHKAISFGWLGRWSDVIDADPVTINALMVIMFMVAFAVIIGPFNLLKLAPRKNRFRIFVTTPIISLVASLILGAVILLGDGIGGYVLTQQITFYDSDRGRLLTRQSYLARASLLLDSSVSIPQESHLLPRKVGSAVTLDENFIVDGPIHQGDYLSNRSWNGLEMIHVEPTRSEIRIIRSTGAGLTLFSSMDTLISEIVYREKDTENVWRARDVRQGQSVEMERIDLAELRRFRSAALRESNGNSDVSAILDRLLKPGDEDRFVALVEPISEVPRLELSNLKEKESYAVLYGKPVLP